MEDNSAYQALFFEETDDHLQMLNEYILTLEKHPDDHDCLDGIFRSAHTLKGMAATMGYEVMTELTHKMENVFDLFKKGTLAITQEHVTLIFKCLDRLENMVVQLRADQPLDTVAIVDLTRELDAITTDVSPHTPLNTETSKEALKSHFDTFASADRMVVQEAKNHGYQAFFIGIRIDQHSMLKGARAFLVMEKLGQTGDILYTEPASEQIEAGEFEQDIYLLYLTKESQEATVESIWTNSEIEQVVVNLIEDQPEQMATEVVKHDPVLPQSTETQATTHISTQLNKTINQSIRVDLSRLDQFLDLVSELVVSRNQLEDASKHKEQEPFKDALDQVSRLTSDLQELVLKIRMQPITTVFNRFPRMVRDLASELEKEIQLVIEGEDTELDKTVVSELSEPLIHLLRNAADHGIESPEKRVSLQKDPKGTIYLAAKQEGNRVVITVADDGKGLDPIKLRESAESKGIDTSHMTAEQIQQLIFHPGFSTAKAVTNISGRGVGMDAVKEKIAQLGGAIEMRSELNQGTTFTIRLPLTLSIIQVLLVRVEEQILAFPLDSVDRVIKIKEQDIIQTVNQEVYSYQETLIPIIRTKEWLEISTDRPEDTYAILVTINHQHYGILVDGLLGQQEIVIKKIDLAIRKAHTYQGATILGNGQIALILDTDAICRQVGAMR